ncbi:MAG: hypothetical protein WAO31_00405 [Rhodoluna sp.]
MKGITRTFNVKDYDELRDVIPTSGLFDMTDCALEIWCPEAAQTDEIEKMTRLVESMVHVTDVKVGSAVENLASSDYTIKVIEAPNRKVR